MVKAYLKCLLPGIGPLLLALILARALLPGAAMADEVFLKNGQRLISPRAWVADGYAHFILQGTADVEIRYSLEIIDRILSSEGRQIYPAAPPKKGPSPKADLPEPVSPSPKTPAPPDKAAAPKPPSASTTSIPSATKLPVEARKVGPGVDTSLLRAKAKKLRNIPFYDPHRKERYWATAQSRHKDVDGAVNALAELFGRTPQWVTAHMGATNDLGEIHLNLIRQLENWHQPPAKASKTPAAGKTGTPKPKKPAAKVTVKKPTKAPSPHRKAVRAANPFASNLPDTQGPYFYNPRRPKKFWANETSRHDSLDGALKALAGQYGRSVDWVEAHMGDSNSLEEIHRNLTQAAQEND